MFNNSHKSPFIKVILFFVIFCITVSVILFCYVYKNYSPVGDWGGFGDFLSGTFGLTISFLSAFLIYIAFHEQAKNNTFIEIYNMQEAYDQTTKYLKTIENEIKEKNILQQIITIDENFKTLLNYFKKFEINNAESNLLDGNLMLELRNIILLKNSIMSSFEDDTLVYDIVLSKYIAIDKLKNINFELEFRSKVFRNIHNFHLRHLEISKGFAYILKAFHLNRLYNGEKLPYIKNDELEIFKRIIELPYIEIKFNKEFDLDSNWKIEICNFSKYPVFISNIEIEGILIFKSLNFKIQMNESLELKQINDSDSSKNEFDNQIKKLAMNQIINHIQKDNYLTYLHLELKGVKWRYCYTLEINVELSGISLKII